MFLTFALRFLKKGPAFNPRVFIKYFFNYYYYYYYHPSIIAELYVTSWDDGLEAACGVVRAGGVALQAIQSKNRKVVVSKHE